MQSGQTGNLSGFLVGTQTLPQSATTGVPYPSYKIKNFTSTISTTLNNGLGALFTKKTDIPAAVKKLAEEVNKQMQGSYRDIAS